MNVTTDNRGWPGARGKVTSRCLWLACRAISIGICLILIGATMATLGFYAHELSIVVHVDGNKTTVSKDLSKDYHLNNLTYIGPVVMGIGGFLIVATCVMTFEARDSAAKVVPARIKRVTANKSLLASTIPSARTALTCNFVQFSRTIQTSIESREFTNGSVPAPLRKCPSAPALVPESETEMEMFQTKPMQTRIKLQPTINTGQRLTPCLLPRQAISVDNPSVTAQNYTDCYNGGGGAIKQLSALKKSDSDVSMAMDLYLPDCSVTLHVQDESKLTEPSFNRRETVKRRPFLRQQQVVTHDSEPEDD